MHSSLSVSMSAMPEAMSTRKESVILDLRSITSVWKALSYICVNPHVTEIHKVVELVERGSLRFAKVVKCWDTQCIFLTEDVSSHKDHLAFILLYMYLTCKLWVVLSVSGYLRLGELVWANLLLHLSW